MKPLTNQEITWSVVELTGLLEDEDSHVHVVRTTKHLALHPYHLNNIQLGLNQILKSLLHTYDKELKGFVLTFKNPKLISNLGEILYDSPFIHIDVDAEFYLFRPLVGSCVKGIVNKKGLDHIVVLVHKIYTISIPKSDDAEEWLGDLVEIGQEVKCYISHIDYMSRPPFICATLKSDYLQGCRININDTVAVNGIENHSDSESRTAASQLDCSQKRKINIDDNAAESHNTVGSVKIKVEKTSTPTEDEAVSDVERDSRRKKRKKRPKPDDDVPNDESEVVVKSERDEALSDRERDSPRKKRKKRHKPDDDVPDDESEVVVKSERDEALSDRERDNPRKKRKKRHKPDEGVLKRESESIVKPERDETPSDRERDSQRKKRKRSRKPDEDVCKDESESTVNSEYAGSERSKKARVLSESPSKLDCSQDRKMGIVITDAINGAAEDHSWINNVKVKQEKFSEVEDNVLSDRDQDRQRKKRKRTKSDV